MASSNPRPKPRKTRTSTPRTTTGCGNCRKRRIKCDEAKPSCRGCVGAGWNCDGYPVAPNPQAHSEASVLSRATVSALNIPVYSLPFRVAGGKEERRLLHYFYNQAASDMSGFTVCNFWTRTVLQSSYHEPTVRHALVALSSLHLDYIMSDLPGARVAKQDTLNQYGKALRMLQKRISAGGQEAYSTAIICSILFHCFETITGDGPSALQHLNQGLKVLSSVKAAGKDCFDDTDSVTDLLVRLDLQATLVDSDRLPSLVLVSNAEKRSGIAPQEAFQGLSDAQKNLDKLHNWFYHFLTASSEHRSQAVGNIPAGVVEEKEQIMQEFTRWLQKFTLLMPSIDRDDSQNVYWACILQIHHRIMYMMLESVLPENEDVFGANPNPSIEEILRLSEKVLLHTRQQNATMETAKNPRRNLSSAMGIIAPLSVLAVKGTQPLAERAVQLLADSRRQEGLYDAAAIVQLLGNLQEVKKQRLQKVSEDGLAILKSRPLEEWTLDLIDRQPHGPVTDICEYGGKRVRGWVQEELQGNRPRRWKYAYLYESDEEKVKENGEWSHFSAASGKVPCKDT